MARFPNIANNQRGKSQEMPDPVGVMTVDTHGLINSRGTHARLYNTQHATRTTNTFQSATFQYFNSFFPPNFQKSSLKTFLDPQYKKTSRILIIIESIQFLQVGRWRFKVNQINQINIFVLLRVCNDGKLKIISKKGKHDMLCVRLRWISAMLHVVVRRSIKIRKCLTKKKDNGHTLSTWNFPFFVWFLPKKKKKMMTFH